MMTALSVTQAEAQQRLPELLAAADQGSFVDIVGDNGRTYHLSVETAQEIGEPPHATASQPPKRVKRRAGTCKGLIEIHDDFDEPLEELREYME